MIIISGDSWSLGEWSADSKELQHGGVSQYFSDDGFDIINLGMSGSSNRETLLRVTNFLYTNPHLSKREKSILIFQTEWTRDYPYMDAEDVDYYHLPIELMNRIISRFYYDLSALSKKFNVEIKIVGGAGDAMAIERFEDYYPGVKIICQSMTNLIVNNDSSIHTPIFSMFSLSNNSDKFFNLFKKYISDQSELDNLMREVEKSQKRIDKFSSNREYFYPDGGHPNRKGHKILYDFIKPEFQ
jgi:hypothetical protein